MTPDYNNFQQQSEIRPSRWKSCWFSGLALILVFALLASSLASVYWVITQREAENGPPQLSTALVKPDSQVDEVIIDVNPMATAVSDQTATSASAAIETENELSINRIVLINNEGQIETIAPNGEDRRTLTNSNQLFQFPAWSPDGSQIAAIGSSFRGGGIYVIGDDQSQTQPQEVYFSSGRNPFYLYWAPDNQQISFLANHPTGGIGLHIADVANETESRVIATGSPFYWKWTDNSAELFIHSGGPNSDARVALIDNEGEEQVPQVTSPGFFQTPGISENGRYWTYSQLKAGGISWLVVQDNDTGEQFEKRHSGSIAMSWSPADNNLAFISGAENESFAFWGPLRVLNADTGEIKVLSPNTVLAFFWSPDGKKIAAITAPTLNPLGAEQQAKENNTTPRRLTKTIPTANQIPIQTPLHQLALSIIDVEKGNGVQIAEFVPTNSFLGQFLPYFDQYTLSHQLWSPDSAALVLPMVKNRQAKIMVVYAGGGQMREVGEGEIAFWSRQ